METVKVDIQKLQLLNDRIAQTLEALNLLRMSVHGIQHSPAVSPWGYGVGALPYSVQPTFGASPYVQYPTQLGYQQWASPFSSFVPGIQHTQTPYGYPTTQFGYPTTQFGYPTSQFGYPTTQFTSPYTSFVPGIQHTQIDPRQHLGQQPWTQQLGQQPWTQQLGQQPWTQQLSSNGISHSAWEPSWQMRPWTWTQMW